MQRNKITANFLLGMVRRYLGDCLNTIVFSILNSRFFQILLNSCRVFPLSYFASISLEFISNNLELVSRSLELSEYIIIIVMVQSSIYIVYY